VARCALNVRFGSLADITARSRHVRFTPLLADIQSCALGQAGHAVSAVPINGFGLETTNRNEGRRRLGLATRTAAISSLNALRFIVAMLPLWCRKTLSPRT
jgi:hypothetical protein